MSFRLRAAWLSGTLVLLALLAVVLPIPLGGPTQTWVNQWLSGLLGRPLTADGGQIWLIRRQLTLRHVTLRLTPTAQLQADRAVLHAHSRPLQNSLRRLGVRLWNCRYVGAGVGQLFPSQPSDPLQYDTVEGTLFWSRDQVVVDQIDARQKDTRLEIQGWIRSDNSAQLTLTLSLSPIWQESMPNFMRRYLFNPDLAANDWQRIVMVVEGDLSNPNIRMESHLFKFQMSAP